MTIYTLLFLSIIFSPFIFFKRSLKNTQIVYILLGVLFLPVISAQSIQDIQRLKSEYEKFQKGQKQLQLPTGVEQGIDPISGLPKEAQLTPYRFEGDLMEGTEEEG